MSAWSGIGYNLVMRFHVGSDHGGVVLREVLVEALREWGYPVLSVSGPARADEKTDYPEIAAEVCKKVLRDHETGEEGADVVGLIVCGTGQGVAMCANKFPGIRAGVVGDAFSAKMIRAHNDANVLCLGQRVLGSGLARTILRAFLDASFEGGRHARRVALIEAVAQQGSSAGAGS